MADTTTLRRCIGSVRFGIESHDAPIEDFPAQPSQLDGLGRMCKTHWTEYTRALRAASGGPRPSLPGATRAESIRTKPAKAPKVAPEATADPV